MSNAAPSLEQIRKALAIAEQIQKLEAELASVLGNQASGSAPATTPSTRGGRRTMSPEARARIVAAQKARWAKIRAEKASGKVQEPGRAAATAPAKAKPARSKRKISPEGRAKMAAAARKRWAARKA